ncbi:manganese catalase family protein, partial [Bacillus sp. WP8]|uniref:manganese catalase family protein n=1 Tax=Bacillus sp. WP8 TaxID=756828 RepID=UPI0021B47F68
MVGGLGAMGADSEGYGWNGKYMIGRGNLMGDLRGNLNGESQGRVEVRRVYEMRDERGVKDMVSLVIGGDRYDEN